MTLFRTICPKPGKHTPLAPAVRNRKSRAAANRVPRAFCGNSGGVPEPHRGPTELLLRAPAPVA